MAPLCSTPTSSGSKSLHWCTSQRQRRTKAITATTLTVAHSTVPSVVLSTVARISSNSCCTSALLLCVISVYFQIVQRIRLIRHARLLVHHRAGPRDDGRYQLRGSPPLPFKSLSQPVRKAMVTNPSETAVKTRTCRRADVARRRKRDAQSLRYTAPGTIDWSR